MASLEEATSSPSSPGTAATKVKGPKGGNKAPIFDVPEEKRLFTADSAGTLTRDARCLSFYLFTPIADPAAAAEGLRAALQPTALIDHAGAVYVAEEGVNAQFSVAVAALPAFEATLQAAARAALFPPPSTARGASNGDAPAQADAEAKDSLGGGGKKGAGSVLDLNLGVRAAAGSPAPFKRFAVKARPQILTDGLAAHSGSSSPAPGAAATATSSSSLWDWHDAGRELEPEEWHRELAAHFQPARPPREGASGSGESGRESGQGAAAAAAAAAPKPKPLLLDCRNVYETEAGRFAGATPLGTGTFAESWAALDAAVEAAYAEAAAAAAPPPCPSSSAPQGEAEPQPQPRQPKPVVYAYCTGGIRCVKVGAYLKQRHGLADVRRLKHGVIGYERWVTEQQEGEEAPASLFEGENFFFDQRPQDRVMPAENR